MEGRTDERDIKNNQDKNPERARSFRYTPVIDPSTLNNLASLTASFGDLKVGFSTEYIAKLKKHLYDKNAYQLIVTEEDMIAGYAAASENLFPEYLRLIELFVDPKFQGKGVAMNLIDRMAVFAQERGLKGIMSRTPFLGHSF